MRVSQTHTTPSGNAVRGADIKRTRRRFTAKYKLQILKEVEACTNAGEIGEVLHRENLYSSNLTIWRKQRDQGILDAMLPKKRGRKSKTKSPLSHRIAMLEKENLRLQEKLKHAEIIIEAQKEVTTIVCRHNEAKKTNT